jgi:ATP-binding cassette, subfamily B, bacterial
MSTVRERAYTDIQLLWRLLDQAKSHWKSIAGLFALSLLATPLALLNPVPLQIIVDHVLGSEPVPRLLSFALRDSAVDSRTTLLLVGAVLLVGVTLLRQLQGLVTEQLRIYTGQQLILNFRARLFRHVQRLSLAFHDSRGTADSIYRIQWDAPAVQHVAVDTVIPFISALTTFSVMLFIIVRVDWQLAVVSLLVAPALGAVSNLQRRRTRPQYHTVTALESSAQAVLHEVLGALRVVKAFGQEAREEQRFIERSAQFMKVRRRLTLDESSFALCIAVITSVGTAMVLFIGARHVQAGTLTLGELLLVVGYLAQFYGPLNTLSNAAANLQGSLASAERAFVLLDESPDVVEQPHARRLTRARGAVTFRDVSFSYDGERLVLRDVSLDVGPGTRVGIIGRTGSGKSTLVSLLTRYYDPSDGQILLDGVDLREYRLSDVRDQFAIVLQDPVLFSASIAENIAYARPGASEEEIMAAAKIANAHDFIMKLPNGYQTLVGERGMRLSGGERQRVSLARAFLKDAPIVILDEPTSSVDVNTESAIIEAIERLTQGRTTFMIAHRQSTLDGCDVLLHIEDGQLVPAVCRSSIDARCLAAVGAQPLKRDRVSTPG